MNAREAFEKLIEMDFETVLDVGCGEGEHSLAFNRLSKRVTSINLTEPENFKPSYIIDFNSAILPNNYDCIWASHVLEHQTNVGVFLTQCFNHLKNNGIFAVTVPPRKDAIVGGHVTLWNAGLLLYNLILAGFDCSEAKVKTYGYNISVIVRKKKARLPELDMDKGDIERLARFFPFSVQQGFDGNINEFNW